MKLTLPILSIYFAHVMFITVGGKVKFHAMSIVQSHFLPGETF